MNAVSSDRVYMRSLATRQSNLALSKHVQHAVDICKAAGFDLVILETSGIGQSDTEIVEHSDVSLYVMTSDYGAATQLEKIDMLDFADVIAINKFDKRGSLDALRDVKKQYRRNQNLFDAKDEDLPIFGTIASQFADPGTNTLYRFVIDKVVEKTGAPLASQIAMTETASSKVAIIPPERVRYLAEIAETSDEYNAWVQKQADIARRLYQLNGTIQQLRARIGQKSIEIVEQTEEMVQVIEHVEGEPAYLKDLIDIYQSVEAELDNECKSLLKDWPAMVRRYRADKYQFKVRDRIIEQDLFSTSLSGTRVSKVSLPRYQDWGDILIWLLRENAPGFFLMLPVSSPSSGRAKTRRECSPARAVRSAPTGVFIMCPAGCRPSGCRRRSIRSRSTAKIRTTGQTSSARSAIRASASVPSTTPKSFIRALTSPTPRRPFQ